MTFFAISFSAESNRMNFLTEVLQAKSTTKCYKVDRKNIHSTVLEVFQKDVNVEFPLRIAFEGEKGLDTMDTLGPI